MLPRTTFVLAAGSGRTSGAKPSFPEHNNEAPRSKLRGITELKHVELPEIIAGLSLPLHIPLDCLPVRSL
ncbi:MAG: hypothetical protein OEV71_16050, partial [Nitrospira sp.]|nr:hypothetical protein [Nitrospira sp.]